MLNICSCWRKQCNQVLCRPHSSRSHQFRRIVQLHNHSQRLAPPGPQSSGQPGRGRIVSHSMSPRRKRIERNAHLRRVSNLRTLRIQCRKRHILPSHSSMWTPPKIHTSRCSRCMRCSSMWWGTGQQRICVSTIPSASPPAGLEMRMVTTLIGQACNPSPCILLRACKSLHWPLRLACPSATSFFVHSRCVTRVTSSAAAF